MSVSNIISKVATIGLLVVVIATTAGCSVLGGTPQPPVVWKTFVPQMSQKLISLTIDQRGVKWVGTDGDGAMALSTDNQQWVAMSKQDRQEANTITDITIDRENNVWVGTLIGVAVVSPDGQTTQTYTTGQELPSYSLQDVTLDRDENPWFATWGGGVVTLDRASGKWTRYTRAEGLLDNRVATVRIDPENNKWFGTAVGISLLTSSGEWRQYGPAAGFGRGAVWAMVGDIDGSLWCATQGGGVIVLSAEGRPVATYTTENGLPDNTVNDVMIDTNGNKWFATNNGLVLLSRDGTTMTTFTTANGLGSNIITELSLDPFGNVWAATYGGGLSLYVPAATQ